jgi:glycosyltransferase involved in cell wall biosynthesis
MYSPSELGLKKMVVYDMSKKTIYINATTCTIGGGAQVAANLIKGSLRSDKFNYIYGISLQVEKHLSALVDINKINYEKFNKPSNPLLGFQDRRDIKNHIKKTNPDMVFTVFGPSYLNVNIKELVGMADPWLTHSTKQSYANHGFKDKVLNKLTVWYKSKWISDNNYWVESDEVKFGLTNRYNINKDTITVIPNTCSDIFRENSPFNRPPFLGEITMAIISANYPHKNLKFAANVINKITESRVGWRVKLITTLQNNEFLTRSIDDAISHTNRVQVEHRGNQTLIGCREIYEEASLVFHPSLLEAFSATYAEAICMKTPLFVSDFGFSRAACGEAAIYIDPFNSETTANKIIEFFETDKIKNELVTSMDSKSKEFLSDAERLVKFENLFEKII